MQAVDQAKAQLDQAKAQVNLADAAIERAQADLKAANANVKEKQADFERENAYLAFRQIQFERIKHLYELRAIEEKLVDQNRKDRDAAFEAKNAAKAAIEPPMLRSRPKRPKSRKPPPILPMPKPKFRSRKPNWRRPRSLSTISEIRAPKDYSGVITKRSFHVGDFIRTADQGGRTPDSGRRTHR